MTDENRPEYSVSSGETDEEGPCVRLDFKGYGLHQVQLDTDEMAAAGFDPAAVAAAGTLFTMQIDAMLLGSNGTKVRLPPFLLDVRGAGMLVAGIRREFDRVGLGPRLTAVIDQVDAHAKAGG